MIAAASVFLHLLVSIGAGADARVEFHPQADTITGSKFQTQRASLKTRAYWQSDSIKVFGEIFAELDAAEAAEQRRADQSFYLQELYVDAAWGDWFIRAGRQPVRWSETWLVPSLDVWTARRWNRLFFDPISEQLIHPTGLRVTYVGSNFEVDTFQNFVPPRDELPEPFPEAEDGSEYEWGVRPRFKFAGFELTGIFADQSSRQVTGAGGSYAFEHFVAKYEGGAIEFEDSEESEFFHSGGLDFFWESWTLILQGTLHRQRRNPFQEENQFLTYASLRRDGEKHSIELQGFYNTETRDQFASGMYTFHWRSDLDISLLAQTYWGDEGSLFNVFYEQTGDFVAGVRLTGHFSL